MNEDVQFQLARQRMVNEQLIERDIVDERVLDAMSRVPRHLFVKPEYAHQAYADGPLPIGNDQTISQPYIVAIMSQLLNLQGDENVLEVGTGSGYQAAVLAHLAYQVHSVERHPELARRSARLLRELGYNNVQVHVGDGTRGWPETAPYAAILVTAAAPQVPGPLLNQLNDGGRLVIPVGGRGNQYLERWTRSGQHFTQEVLIPVAFVPLLGEFGWRD